MKLFHSPASPFVRKVRVLMHETGLQDAVELVECATTPMNPDAGLVGVNPLGKIPCLVSEDAGTLFDSRVICEYLDGMHGGAKMFPAASPARWAVLRRQALGDGVMDAGVLRRYETFLRPQEIRWDVWIEAQTGKIMRAVDAMAAEADALASAVDIGSIACGCALGYLDFRTPELNWRQGRDKLAAWYEGFSARPSMKHTLPPG